MLSRAVLCRALLCTSDATARDVLGCCACSWAVRIRSLSGAHNGVLHCLRFPRCVERERCECYSDYLHVTAKCTVVARAELGSMFELESDLGRYGHPSHVL